MTLDCNIHNYLNKIICGDSLTIMKEMPSNSVDLVITSPPYNIKNSTGNGFKTPSGNWKTAQLVNGYQNYGDNIDHGEYVEWQKNILIESMRLLKDDGAIFYNHKWRVQGGLIQDRQDIVSLFPVRQIIIWQRSGGLNFNDGYFLPTYEVIYLIAKPKFKLKKGANKIGDVWRINQEKRTKHPAPFPVDLPLKILNSVESEIILDPFSGSGTTALACMMTNKKYIGIELSQVYCDLSEKRLVEFSSKLF